MKQTLCPLLLFITMHAAGQRVASFSAGSVSLSSPQLSEQKASTSSAKTFAISGGEFKFKAKDRIGFHAVSVRTLDADFNKIQKNSMAVAGFSVMLFNIEGLSSKVYVSQGFNMRQGIIYYPRKENVTFEGLSPIFSVGFGTEYKINKYIEMFTRFRWIGGDVSHLGNEGFSYGQFVFHTGISCKITSPKKWS